MRKQFTMFVMVAMVMSFSVSRAGDHSPPGKKGTAIELQKNFSVDFAKAYTLNTEKQALQNEETVVAPAKEEVPAFPIVSNSPAGRLVFLSSDTERVDRSRFRWQESTC